MKLNSFEFLIINNPLRNILQNKELKELKNFSSISNIEKALKIGCGIDYF